MVRHDEWGLLYREVGARIAQARGNAELSQNKLAQKVGVSRTSIVNIEAGRQRLPIHLLWRIADVLEVDSGDLLPSKADLAESTAPVQLDEGTIREIERVAKDNPAMTRHLYNFVQQAKRSLSRRDGAGGAPTTNTPS